MLAGPSPQFLPTAHDAQHFMLSQKGCLHLEHMRIATVRLRLDAAGMLGKEDLTEWRGIKHILEFTGMVPGIDQAYFLCGQFFHFNHPVIAPLLYFFLSVLGQNVMVAELRGSAFSIFRQFKGMEPELIVQELHGYGRILVTASEIGQAARNEKRLPDFRGEADIKMEFHDGSSSLVYKINGFGHSVYSLHK